MEDRTRPLLVLVGAVGDIIPAGVGRRHSCNIPHACLIDRDCIWVRLGNDPCGEKALHQRRHQFRFRVPAQLQERFNHLSQISDAPVLVAPLTVHHMENIGQARPGTVCLYPCPLCF